MVSNLSRYEPTLNDFFKKNIINYDFDDYTDNFEKESIKYRLLCELIINLTADYKYSQIFTYHRENISQLLLIIEEGLKRCGYGLKVYKEGKITYKKDIAAEAIAANNPDYKESIFNYLIAKNIKEKASALTALSNQLEAAKTSGGFTRQNRKYIQIMRHPDEKKKEDDYSWFFEKQSFEANMDKLFRILICYCSHLSCDDILANFESKITANKK